jgi:hypothetical protein
MYFVSDDYSMNSGESMGAGGPGGSIQQNYSPQPSPHHWSQGSLTSGIPPGGGMQQMQGYVYLNVSVVHRKYLFRDLFFIHVAVLV